MRRFVVVGATLALVVVTVGPVRAQQRQQPDPKRAHSSVDWMGSRVENSSWWLSPSVRDGVGMTEQEAKQIESVVAKGRKDRLAASDAARAAYQDLLGALGSPEAEPSRVAELRGRYEALKSTETAAAVDLVLDLREILGAERFAALCELSPRACAPVAGFSPRMRPNARRKAPPDPSSPR